MHAIRPRRSVLYMPGSNARAMEKARGIPADAVILDLEDAVAPDMKDVARQQVIDAVNARGFGKREVIVRINGLSTAWGEADLAATIAAKPDAILAPKVSTLADLRALEDGFAKHNADSSIALWAMIETPLAILNIAVTLRVPAAGLPVSSWAPTISSRNCTANTRRIAAICLQHLASPVAAARGVWSLCDRPSACSTTFRI